MSVGNTYGLLVRTYTPKVEEVQKRIDRAIEHARQALVVQKEFPALRRILFLVPDDNDCGQTWPALAHRISAIRLVGVEVRSFSGYHSCEVLNEGFMELWFDTRYALIVSGKAMPYLTASNLRTIDTAFAKGAKVAGLAIDELRGMVLSGRIQNTFAAWDIEALRQVGGFDCRTDVEEIAPLIRLTRKFGPCIAPIEVGGAALDVHTSATAEARHQQVMAMKLANQQAECVRLGTDFEFIRRATMV